MGAIDLYAAVVDQIAVGPHPPDVGKVSRRTRGEVEHHLSRDPASIAQGQSNVVLAEQCENPFGYPAAMSELDGDAQVAGNAAEKVHQRRQLARLEIGARLNQHRSQLVAELAYSLEKDFRRSG